MNNRKIQAVLFDMDGTLLDTAPDIARSLNILRERHQLPPLSIEQVREVTSYGSPGLLRLAFDISNTDERYPEIRKEFIALYEADITAQTRPFEGISTVLDSLSQAQIPWGVVTNKAENLAQKILDNLSLSATCACLIGGDSTPHPKPAPDPLLAACKIINRQPQNCLYVGDSPLDIQAAKSAKMPSIAALYGYIPKPSDPHSWGADLTINTPLEILGYL